MSSGRCIPVNTMAEVKNWQQTAAEYQQEMCNNFGDVDWDVYLKGEAYILKDKIRLLLYGLSSVVENQETENHVDKICQVITKEGTCRLEDSNEEEAIYMVFFFVFGTNDGENIGSWPVFRVPKDNTGNSASFIDLNCRVYESWKDFLKNNKLPACEYCYPKNGKYELTCEGKVAIEFGQTPEAKTSKKVMNVLDVTSTGVGFGASVLTLASFAFPVTAPFLAAAAWAAGGVSVYSAVRSSTTLHDRRRHKQSIGLSDKEARSCYLSIAGSTLGLGASAATAATVKAAQSGRVMGKIASSTVTALNGGALMMNGAGIANGLHYLIEKRKEGQLTAFDVAQLSASLLLFCHAAVNFKTAHSIIEKQQNDVINNYENSLGSRWKRIVFRSAVKCTTKLWGSTRGKGLIIRNIKHINTADDFFASLLPEDESQSNSHTILISQSNIGHMYDLDHLESLLSVNEKMELYELLMKFTEPVRKIILDLSNSLFQTIEKVRGFNFMHITHFISKFVSHLTNLICRGERQYVLSLFQHEICRVPPQEMSNFEYCLALFKELLRNPAALLTIYKKVQMFYSVLLQRTNMTRERPELDFIQLISACSILLKTDKPHWELIIDFAKSIFDAMKLTRFSSLITILKDLILYMQESILDMQRRYQAYRCEPRERIENQYEDQLESDITRALGSMYNDEIRMPFMNRIQGMNLDENSEVFPLRCMQAGYTMENPLIIERRFWAREQLDLPTEVEILDICKQTLKVDTLPSNSSITHQGLEIFVTIGDLLVVIKCDLPNGRVISYAILPA